MLENFYICNPSPVTPGFKFGTPRAILIAFTTLLKASEGFDLIVHGCSDVPTTSRQRQVTARNVTFMNVVITAFIYKAIALQTKGK